MEVSAISTWETGDGPHTIKCCTVIDQQITITTNMFLTSKTQHECFMQVDLKDPIDQQVKAEVKKTSRF